jgi:hypothetical protein
MTAQDLTDAEAERVARFEAAPAAPESFDPIAALRRVEALAEWLEDQATDAFSSWDTLAAREDAADRIRAALAPQADDGPRDIWLRS